MTTTALIPTPNNFIEDIIVNDLQSGKRTEVHTRFPPEPNGYLHIGHAKSICLNFGIAKKFNGFAGRCNLRMDDTNPAKEETEYVESIEEDVKWLGFDWDEREYFASDYYDKCYEFALELIKRGKAYVCELSGDQVSEYRGTLTQAGRSSPWRDRRVEENLDLFAKMTRGEIDEGRMFLRAKIDMASSNMNLRDPAIYRIKKVEHHRIGAKWVVYPMYDYAHPLGDWLEGITHSICTLEFEAHRPLYDWVLEALELPNRPQQIEFARLNLTYTVMSKRLLLELVKGNFVMGWDDPRMPTISGLRRRGYTPSSIRSFAEKIGVAKADSVVDINLLYFCLRDELNTQAERRMGVLEPLKVVITNWPEGHVEMIEADNNPEDPSKGKRMIAMGREIWIEADDFMEVPSKKYFRLAPGAEVRLKHAYFITCKEVIKDAQGKVVELHCEYDAASKGGSSPDGRKVKGTLHWVSVDHALDCEVRLLDHLFTFENLSEVAEGKDYKDYINPNSLIRKQAKIEPSLKDAKPYDRIQFLRHGYFCVDNRDSKPGAPVFNRIVELKDSWAKEQKK